MTVNVSNEALDFASRLSKAAEAIFTEMGLNGAQVTEGVAALAGITAFLNSRPGKSADTLALMQMTAQSVHDAAAGSASRSS